MHPVHSSSMRVRVSVQREYGVVRPPYGPRPWLIGELHLTQRTKPGGGMVPVLQLIGASVPSLYDPRLVGLSSGRLRFIGYERIEQAWVMQEWVCEVGPPGGKT
jgi:hypothetical protein